MEGAPPPRSPEHYIAELLRVTLLLMKPYAPSVASNSQLRELESVMRCTIEMLERTDSREKGHSCRTCFNSGNLIGTQSQETADEDNQKTTVATPTVIHVGGDTKKV